MGINHGIFQLMGYQMLIWWYTYASEKRWTSSVGMMTFPYPHIYIYMESHKIHVPNHRPDIDSIYMGISCIHITAECSIGDFHFGWPTGKTHLSFHDTRIRLGQIQSPVIISTDLLIVAYIHRDGSGNDSPQFPSLHKSFSTYYTHIISNIHIWDDIITYTIFIYCTL